MTRQFDVTTHGEEGEGTVTCRNCGELFPMEELDRWLWCHPCALGLERRARRGQHLIAALITLPFIVWILVEGTGSVLPTYAWALPLLAAYYLGSRIGRVLIRGYVRGRRVV